MMKKVLSVALSVIMVLSVLCVPGFAADPAAVEYTVSSVSYAGEVYDELNDAAENGYAMIDGITSVPDNGKKLVPSVEISASAETTATVIFAVYTEGVLTNAFYETKAVGTTAVEFSKEITVVDNEKETYKVFVLGADGKAIAPVSNFPVADGAMEYIVISYADGTEDKYFGADLEGTTLVSAISDARKAANPSIKVVPVDNTTVVTIDIAADFWTNGATVKLTAIDGTEVTYTIMSDMIKAGFTPVLGKIYQYEGATLTKTIKTYEKQYASFEASAEVVNVTVPYGTASVNLDAITVYENGVPKKSSAEEISMDGAAEKEYMVGVGSKEYKFVFKWDDSVPYINNVKFGGDYAARSAVLRADNGNAVGYTMSTDISKAHETATVANGITAFTVNDTEIAIDENFTVLAIAREDNFARADMVLYAHAKGISAAENEAWTTFTVSEPATVYVKMSHANAAEAGFAWKEGVAAGWTKATSSNQGTVYYKTFAAGETVNIPSQVVTEDELAFVNAKLETAYPASGAVQFKYALAEGDGAHLYYSADGKAYDDATKAWEEHPTGKNTASDGAKLQMADGKYYRGLYYRNAGSSTGLSVSYGSTFFIAVAFDNVPGEGGDPEVPPVDPDEPDEPAAPTLEWESAIALTGTPKTQSQGPANRRELHKDGLYRVGAVSGSVELNPEETTVNLTVPYGVEVVKLNGGVSVNLLDDADHAATATVTVAEVEYTVNVSWAAYAYDAENADMPMLYDLEYTADGRTGLYDTNWYYAIPTNLVLDADHDYVVGEGDLKGMKEDGSGLLVDKPSGTWLTKQSHDNVNLTSTNSGSQVNRLHLGPTAFESWVTAGYLETKYDLNGATSIIANYTDVTTNNTVRYKFKAGVDGYVIVASNKANTALTAEDGWAQLTGATMKFTNSSTTAQGTALNNPPEGHTNVAKSYAEWSGACDYIYAKKVSVGEVVEVAESTVASGYPPIVIVATEDMITLDIEDTEDPEAPVEPEIPPVEPEEPTAAKLASITYSTAIHAKYTEAVTETGVAQAWQEDATEYIVTVPIGTGTVTVSAAADYAETPNTLAEAVTVDMAGKDTATAEILGNTVTFKWDATDPYISEVAFDAAYLNRWSVDFGTDGSVLTEVINGTSGAGCTPKGSSIAALLGADPSMMNKYLIGIPMGVAIKGQPHMATSSFNLIAKEYPANDASDAALSFKVSENATVYTRAVTKDNQWEELVEAGWTAEGTMGGKTLYKKTFNKGDLVLIPGTPIDEDEIAALNESTTKKYIQYAPDATIELADGTAPTQQAAIEAWSAANHNSLPLKNVKAGEWIAWDWDAATDKPTAPHFHSYDAKDGVNNGVQLEHAVFGALPVFYVQFAEPAVPMLTSVSYTTEVLAQYVDATAVTETATETFTEAAAEYVVKVPVGTNKVTVSAATDNEEGALTESVVVELAGANEKSVEILGYTVKFVWDDTERPYIYNFNFAGAFDQRANVQFGDSAPTVNADKRKDVTVPYGAIGSELTSLTFADGLTTPTADKNLVVIGAGQALVGTGHQNNGTFPWVFGDFPANDASDAALSFNMGQDGTVYLATTARDNEWEELEAKGFTKVGTAAGKTVFSKAFSAGDLVLVPNPKYSEDEAAAQNAALTNQKIAKTTEENQSLFAAANITNDIAIGDWVYWNTDEEGNIISAVNAAGSKSAHPLHPTHDKNGIAFFVVFGDAQPTAPEAPVEPEIPPEDPEEPPVVDNSANQLDLTFTTALALTDMASTGKYANAVNRVSGEKSIYAGGFYMPMLVSEAVNATVDHEAKTAVVTVPFGTEVVNLNAATVAGTGIDLADNATVVMLNDNGAAKTFDVVAGENTYAVTVKWADAADANMGLASTGADVYGVKYKMADLWAGSTKAYSLVPTTLDMSVALEIDAAYYEGLGETVPTEFADGVRFVATGFGVTNMTSKNSVADYGDLARYKIFNDAMKAWVAAGIIADTDDLDGATLVNTGVHYQTHNSSKFTASGANVDMDSYLAFNVEEAGVVYVIPGGKGTFTNDDTWTKVEAETLLARRNGASGNYYYPMETYDDEVYVKNVEAGDAVTVPVTVASGDHTPIVIYDAGATFVAPTPEEPVEPEIPEEEVQPLGDIEDGGVLAETVEAPDAVQDAASTDITVEGNKGEEARGEHVVVYVLADGKTFADLQTALAGGSGDLFADGVILGMGSATVDENGDYTVDMTLPNSVTSGSYDVVIDDETHEDALEYTAISEKVAAYNAIVTGAADPFAHVDLIISTNDIYTGLTPAGKAAVEASVLAKDAVAALPEITETAPGSGEYVGLENIAVLGAIIDTRIAVEALNDGADAAELALVWDYILPEADAESDDIVAVAAAIYEDATALNATGKANVVAAISEKAYETKTVNGAQVSVKAQVAEDFAEAVFVELINNTGYTNINAVAAVVNDYIAAGVFEELTSVSTATLSTIVKDYTINSYADFEAKVAAIVGGDDTPSTGGTEVVPSTPTTGGTTSGSMSNSTVEPTTPVTPVQPAKPQLSDFIDANDASWAATALQTMLDRGIMSGYEDNTIRPNNNATRQEVAKMLVEAFSEVRAGAWTGFADVPAGSWYYSYVATAQQDGIIKGVSATEFGTDAMITREDLSVLIYRFLVNKGITLDTSANRAFTDAASISDYAADAINALANAGVVNGYGDGSFNPKGNATRAEIAQIIANVLVLYAL